MLKKQYLLGLEAGTDEAGRGCLAGPVTAAAVILKPDFKHPLLDDSKKLSANQREELKSIIEASALAYGVAHISPEKIDEINILQASILAMHKALEKLEVQPEHILVDGNKFHPFGDIPYQCIVGGDGKYQNIAAASVLAKTHRDTYMQSAAEKYPAYGWQRNKGYPTAEHREAIRLHGITPLHRKSFRLLTEQLEFGF